MGTGCPCNFDYRPPFIKQIIESTGVNVEDTEEFLNKLIPPVDRCILRGAEGVAYNVHFCYDTQVTTESI